MSTRREFLRRSLIGAAALAAGCSRSSEAESLAGVQPLKYGEAQSQLTELQLPNAFGPHPVVVVIHGGWWRTGWDRRGTREMARDLVKNGYATWNLEYRLVGEEGGGWPGTFEDISRGIDYLADRAPDFNLDLDRVALLGHSAGGHLALWAGARQKLSPNSIGGDPRVVPRGVVALAPVTDLVAAANANLGEGAVQQLLGGGPEQVPLVYLATSPVELLPIPVPQVLFHAVDDTIVPIDQSRTFVERSRSAGSTVELAEVPEGGHFSLIVTSTDAWAQVRERIESLLAPRRGGG